MRRLNVVLLALVACAQGEVEEKDLPARVAFHMCNLERECARGMWQNAYYGQADCRDQWEYTVEVMVEVMDDLDCDYSKKEAGKAIDDLATMDCEDWFEDVYQDQGTQLMDEVWDECGNFQTTLPYSRSLP